MLAAAALRLAAIEALCPTAAVNGEPGATFPTMAEHRVYDSVPITPDSLLEGMPYTPALSVYTEAARVERRGASADSVTGNATVDLIIIAELAELARDVDGNPITEGGLQTDAIINGDGLLKLVLEAFCAQVHSHLVRSPKAAGLRRVMGAVNRVTFEQAALPQYGIRFMRQVITFETMVAADKFTDEAGLPEPIRSVAAELPAGSYAKAQLAKLATYFAATTRDQLEAIAISVDDPSDPPDNPLVP